MKSKDQRAGRDFPETAQRPRVGFLLNAERVALARRWLDMPTGEHTQKQEDTGEEVKVSLYTLSLRHGVRGQATDSVLTLKPFEAGESAASRAYHQTQSAVNLILVSPAKRCKGLRSLRSPGPNYTVHSRGFVQLTSERARPSCSLILGYLYQSTEGCSLKDSRESIISCTDLAYTCMPRCALLEKS